MYWNQTRAQWETVESYMDQNGYLVCNTNHFSTWTVAEIEPEAEPSTEPTEDNNIPTVYIVAIVVVAIVAVASGLIAYKKRK
jgi:putative exporter of polyketide antibiotics